MKYCLILFSFVFSFGVLGSDREPHIDLIAKINEMAALESVEYVSLAQAENIFDLPLWRYKIAQKKRKSEAILPYIANAFADQMRLAAVKKNGKIKDGFMTAVLSKEEWQRIHDMKLTVMQKGIRTYNNFFEVDVLAYPDLADPAAEPDATVILRKTKQGLRVSSIRIEGIDVFNLALDGLQAKRDEEVGGALLENELISSEQVREYNLKQ